MKKADLKPYFDALATTFDKKIHEGQGYQIFDQSENRIDVIEGSPAEYLEELTGEKLSEEIHGNYWYHWGLLSEINHYIEGEPAIQEQLIFSYTTTGFTGSDSSFRVLKLLNNHYISRTIDGRTYHFFKIIFNGKDVDLSRFIVDYDTYNVGKVRNQMISMDAAPVKLETEFVNPEQLEKEYRAFLNEYYKKPVFKRRIGEFFPEALRGYTKKHYEKYLNDVELNNLYEELNKSEDDPDLKKLSKIYIKVIFANYR